MHKEPMMTISEQEKLMELKLSTIKEELNRCWVQIDRQGDIRFKIKTWGTTAWLASLAFYGKEYLPANQAVILVFLSIISFYMMELYWVGVGDRWKIRKSNIEDFLAALGELENFQEIRKQVFSFTSPGLHYSAPTSKKGLITFKNYTKYLYLPSIVLPYYILFATSFVFFNFI